MAMRITALKLPAALEEFVASQVRAGAYRSREAAIVAAVLHQKRRSEQLAWLQSEIQKGLDSGPTGKLDINAVVRRGRRLAARAALVDFDAVDDYIANDSPPAAAEMLRAGRSIQ
jgi:putative addiction module CopG family antidote